MRKIRINKKEFICETCHKIFENVGGRKWQRFCSKKCSAFLPKCFSCVKCGKVFSNKRGQKILLFCSKFCFLTRKVSEETKQKMSIAHKGHFTTKETKKKISEAQIGKIIPPKQRLKMSIAHKGIKYSLAHRKGM